MYRATAILSRVHAAFFNYNYLSEMTNMSDEIVFSSIMTVLDLEFKRELQYHDKGHDSDNDYGLPGHNMKPVCIHLVSTTEASFNPVDYKGVQCLTSHSHQDYPGMGCLSTKESAND